MRFALIPTCPIGLAHQVILPEVAEPEGWEELADDELGAADVDPQAASTNAEVASTSVVVLVLFRLNLCLPDFISFISLSFRYLLADLIHRKLSKLCSSTLSTSFRQCLYTKGR